jgi:hypothetical protein
VNLFPHGIAVQSSHSSKLIGHGHLVAIHQRPRITQCPTLSRIEQRPSATRLASAPKSDARDRSRAYALALLATMFDVRIILFHDNAACREGPMITSMPHIVPPPSHSQRKISVDASRSKFGSIES